MLRLLLAFLCEPLFRPAELFDPRGSDHGPWSSAATASDAPFASLLFHSLLNTVRARCADEATTRHCPLVAAVCACFDSCVDGCVDGGATAAVPARFRPRRHALAHVCPALLLVRYRES